MAGDEEPMDYIPEDIRKQLKLGEYNDEVMKEIEEIEKEKRKGDDNENDET